MYNMYGPWCPPMFPPMTPGLTLQQAQEGEEFFKKLRKEMKEHEDSERLKKNKREIRKFTFLETMGLMVIFGPIVGITYLYFFQYIMQQTSAVLNVPH